MLANQPWFRFEEAMPVAYRQCLDEGKAVEEDWAAVEEIAALPYGDPQKRERAAALWEKWEAMPVRADFGYEEPDSLEEILKCRPAQEKRQAVAVSYDKVYGAWLGRCGGCLLGQPVEGWRKERIGGLLKDTGNFPVKGYISSQVPQSVRERYGIVDDAAVYGSNKVNWINNTDGMPEDDDTNYTILALKLMEQKGFDFTPYDVGACWLGSLPVLHVCTAERVAYCNMINGINPPRSGAYKNAYREYIGAQIRGDFFGYVCPGEPQLAAALAWRDASISHVKNGIYGEMFVAAMLAEAAVNTDMEQIVQAGLMQIPQNCRLAKAVRDVLSWWKAGVLQPIVEERICRRYDEEDGYDWCHVISNAMIVCMGLLYGSKDFEKTMDICLRAGFDTDCNCATAGSVVGMLLGAQGLPEKWLLPLKDRIRSGVDGMGQVQISELAKRTVAVCTSRQKGRDCI